MLRKIASAAVLLASVGSVIAVSAGTDQSTEKSILRPPEIKSFWPPFGPSGTTVSIEGRYFAGATQVTFGNLPAASFVVRSDGREISAVAPSAGVTGLQGKIAVITPAGVSVTQGDFTIWRIFMFRF